VRTRALAAIALASLAFPAVADAHVEIVSTEVGDGALFTATSPNENTTQDMTGLRLTIPAGLEVEAIGDAPGFTGEIIRDQSGKAVALSWQGGRLPPEHVGLFEFEGSLDSGTDHVRLNGIQTFADGSTKTWTPEISASHSHGGSDTAARVLAAAALVVALGAAGLTLAGTRRRPA
jgi:uncharacterized protein YcnI